MIIIPSHPPENTNVPGRNIYVQIRNFWLSFRPHHLYRVKLMPTEDQSVTTISSICTILLRELRTERGIHQAQVADWIGKTPSAWTKIESGKSPLQFDTFIRVCKCFQVWPSVVLATAERYESVLFQKGWAVLVSELDGNEDALLRLAQEYWASPGCRNAMATRFNQPPVLNGPIVYSDGSSVMANVFRFALDIEFRQLQLEPTIEARGAAFG